jgi:hypothetical protein
MSALLRRETLTAREEYVYARLSWWTRPWYRRLLGWRPW